MKEFFKNISTKVKVFFAVIFTIISSLFLINYSRNRNEKEIDKLNRKISSTKGENKILEEINNTNNLKLEDIDKSIIDIRNDIEKIDQESKDESLDDFFDKRGF